jgi:carboxypeptidase T
MRGRLPHPARAAAPRLALAATLLVLAGAWAPPRATAASDYPAGYRGFHTYAEMVAQVNAVAAAHPDIVHVFSIGKSAKGRSLLAAKISDNASADEPEPEVLFDGLTHGNEPMGLEMTLAILGWLTDGYGSDSRVTSLVDSTETWIVFAVNPDGQAYDYSSGHLRNWRKNRQATSGSRAIGTDLNRNFGYRWGGTGSSGDPFASRFRGRSAFSAPETRAVRDFVRSRVVGGRQQIRASISFHEFGRHVLWPYAATKTDVPADMTADDHRALVTIGRAMASRSRYAAHQTSDVYHVSGTTADWLYGTYRVFAYTVELSASDYPKDTAIGPETRRNRDAVLYLLERAGCPYAVLGSTVRGQRCGAFDDDLEVARGWTVNPDGTDTAPASGRWVRGNPQGTSSGGTALQRNGVPSGRLALVTGAPAGPRAGAYDLDGRTTVRSVPIALPAAAGQRLVFRWLFAHPKRTSSSADHLRAIVEEADGTQTVVWERLGSAAAFAGSWRSAAMSLDAWAGQTIRLRFEAVDGASGSILEAGIDDVRVTQPGS